MSDDRIIAAFGEDHASRLTHVTLSQLRYWDRIGFYRPSISAGSGIAFSRVYSFKDIVALRVLNVLRNQYGVSLHHLRDVSDKLSELGEDRWTGATLYVLNKRVVWVPPDTGQPEEVVSGQYVVPTLVLDVMVEHARRDVQLLQRRDVANEGKIERSRHINHNAPVMAGTRIPVAAIKRFAQAGYSAAQIVQEYPDLTEKDVAAALEYSESRAAA